MINKFIIVFISLWLIAGYCFGDNTPIVAKTTVDNREGEHIDWQVLSSGGTYSSNTQYQVYGTTSQTSVISMESSEYCISTGFWGGLYGACSGGNCCDVPGDANGNGTVNILDITYLIAYLYQGGPAPECMYEGDANGNCAVNILDITLLINYLYLEGPAPVHLEAADVNSSGAINILDITFLISFLYQDGLEPYCQY